MATTEELKAIVGELMKTDAVVLDESSALTGLLASSIGRARLDAKLRERLGVTNPAVYTVRSFGELCQALGVDGADDPTVATVRARPHLATKNLTGAGVALGVDIQSVAALPEETDYWEGDFYRQHFTRQEIGYSLLQPSPRESFAAAWCAKEALRKADNRWVGVDWKLTEITHDAAGKPTMRSGEDAIACAVSLSHTEGFAIAVVAMAETPSLIQEAGSVEVAPAVEGSSSHRGLGLPMLVSVVALLVSLATAAYVVLR